jgi:hypothetical protein
LLLFYFSTQNIYRTLESKNSETYNVTLNENKQMSERQKGNTIGESAAAAARGANDIIFIFVNEFRTQKSELPEVKSFIFSSFSRRRALSIVDEGGKKRVKKAKLRREAKSAAPRARN